LQSDPCDGSNGKQDIHSDLHFLGLRGAKSYCLLQAVIRLFDEVESFDFELFSKTEQFDGLQRNMIQGYKMQGTGEQGSSHSHQIP